jgi:peroxiredoxin
MACHLPAKTASFRRAGKMTTSPKIVRIAGWVLFAAASLAINYEVKYAMHRPKSGSVQALGSIKVGQEAPDFTLQDLSGHPATLTFYRGRTVVLMDFWATWCGPCRMAMPGLQDLADKYKGGGLEILSVNQGEEADQVRSFIEPRKYTFHVVLDKDQSVGNQYGVKAIPTLVVVDKKGVVQWLSVGYSQNEDDLQQLVAKLVKE